MARFCLHLEGGGGVLCHFFLHFVMAKFFFVDDMVRESIVDQNLFNVALFLIEQIIQRDYFDPINHLFFFL